MMTKLILTLLILTASLFAEPKWTHSYEQAKTQALESHKAVMVMLSLEGCDACWYMENIVFEDKVMKSLIMDNFIPVYLDIKEDEIPEHFVFIGTPTFYFTRANGEKLGHRINGASNVKDFTSKINAILDELKQQP